MALLVALGQAGRPLSIRELGLQTSLPRPTVHRLLMTLQTGGMVTPVGGRYVIGSRVLWLASRRLAQVELRAVGRPYLLDLRNKTGETVHMAVLEQGQVVYVDKVESPGPMRMASAIGGIMPAHSTALGKAMLAYLPTDQVRTILQRQGMVRRTAQTITDTERLLADLEAVRDRGYSIDNVENEEGIRCVGAAVFDHQGRVAGAISVSGSAHSITVERIRRELGPRVRETARLISRAMGWQDTSAARG
jgi:DNA-binding IclR family transcriptional regulator